MRQTPKKPDNFWLPLAGPPSSDPSFLNPSNPPLFGSRLWVAHPFTPVSDATEKWGTTSTYEQLRQAS